jgi:phosphatidylinositol alpha-1,6-mannosyltransferase
VFNLLGPARAQALLPPARRSPYLLFLNGIEVWRPLSAGRRRALLGASTRLAISRYTAERAREFTPELGAVEVMPLALEERPPQGEVDAALLARAGIGFVLTVGRLHSAERYKGHDQMLEAWPRIAREQPGARWVIAGAGDDRQRLEAAAARLGVAERVLFTGFASEATLAELYARCGLFALPSSGEGFGLVYVEAMRAGKPCLALAATAAAEIVVDGETGVLLAEAGPEPLAAAVLRLLRAPDCAARLGAAGARRYQQSFRFASFRDRLAPYLRQLIHWESPAHVRS